MSARLDTDSLLVALAGPSLESLVKPEHKEEWKDIEKVWFADNTPASQKEPGLLKSEFDCAKNGIFWNVAQKSDILKN